MAYQGIYQALDGGMESLVISLLRQLDAHITVGRYFLCFCQKWTDGSFTDLVGISDNGICIACLVGYVFLKRIRKNKVENLG